MSGSQSVMGQTPLAWSTLNKGMPASQIPTRNLVVSVLTSPVFVSSIDRPSASSMRLFSRSKLQRNAGVANDLAHGCDIAGVTMLEQEGALSAEGFDRIEHDGGR